MTLFDQESDYSQIEPTLDEADRTQIKRTRYIPSVQVPPGEERSMDISDQGRLVTTESCVEEDCSPSALFQLNSTSLFRLSDHDVKQLCEKLGSVDMSGAVTPSYELIDEHEPNDAATRFDSAMVFTQDKEGDTMLHSAIILQEIVLIMICIQRAASYTWLSIRNNLFQTPLHLAVLTKQSTVVRKLVTSGADITSRDRDGNTALHIACRDGLTDIATKLLEPVRYHEVQENAYEIPYQRMPQDFTIANYEGYTCLHLAANNGHREIVEMLIEKDIDLNMGELKTGRTILHNACISGDIMMVRLLLRNKKCNMNARSYDGLTPFDFARVRSQDSICMILAAAGARYGDDEIDSD